MNQDEIIAQITDEQLAAVVALIKMDRVIRNVVDMNIAAGFNPDRSYLLNDMKFGTNVPLVWYQPMACQKTAEDGSISYVIKQCVRATTNTDDTARWTEEEFIELAAARGFM